MLENITVGLIGMNPDKMSSGHIGGIDRYAVNLAKGMRDRGVEVHPIWKGYPRSPISKTIHSYTSMPRETIKQVKENNFDVIHAPMPGFSTSFPLIKGTAKVATVHDLIPKYHYKIINPHSGKSRIKNYFNYLVFTGWMQTLKFSDSIISVSSQTEEELRDEGFNEVTTVNEYVEERYEPKGNTNPKKVGYLGPITHRKNILKAIEVFSKMKKLDEDITFDICGKIDKPEHVEILKKKIHDLALVDSVNIRGFIPESQLVNTLSSFGVMIFPTQVEGFGLPILETVKCGTPVVVSEKSKVPKEIKSMTEIGDGTEDMARRALDVIGSLPHSIELTEKFTRDKMIDETLEVYEEAIKNDFSHSSYIK